MTRSTVPTLHCDNELGCDAWDVDYYACFTSRVNGVQIATYARAPGWTVTPENDDLCPQCSPPTATTGAPTAETSRRGDATDANGAEVGE